MVITRNYSVKHLKSNKCLNSGTIIKNSKRLDSLFSSLLINHFSTTSISKLGRIKNRFVAYKNVYKGSSELENQASKKGVIVFKWIKLILFLFVPVIFFILILDLDIISTYYFIRETIVTHLKLISIVALILPLIFFILFLLLLNYFYKNKKIKKNFLKQKNVLIPTFLPWSLNNCLNNFLNYFIDITKSKNLYDFYSITAQKQITMYSIILLIAIMIYNYF